MRKASKLDFRLYRTYHTNYAYCCTVLHRHEFSLVIDRQEKLNLIETVRHSEHHAFSTMAVLISEIISIFSLYLIIFR